MDYPFLSKFWMFIAKKYSTLNEFIFFSEYSVLLATGNNMAYYSLEDVAKLILFYQSKQYEIALHVHFCPLQVTFIWKYTALRRKWCITWESRPLTPKRKTNKNTLQASSVWGSSSPNTVRSESLVMACEQQVNFYSMKLIKYTRNLQLIVKIDFSLSVKFSARNSSRVIIRTSSTVCNFLSAANHGRFRVLARLPATRALSSSLIDQRRACFSNALVCSNRSYGEIFNSDLSMQDLL